MKFCGIFIVFQGDIRTTRRITIPLLETVQLQGFTKMICHTKRVHVMMKAPAQHYSDQAITALTYTELRLSPSEVTLCVKKLSARSVKFPAKMTT